MEEVLKALAPWPLAQGIIIGFLIAAGGIWAMRRGMQDNRKRDAIEGPLTVRVEYTDEEKRWQWELYKQVGHLETNSFAIVHHLEQMVELERGILLALNRIADTRWNNGQ